MQHSYSNAGEVLVNSEKFITKLRIKNTDKSMSLSFCHSTFTSSLPLTDIPTSITLILLQIFIITIILN